MIVTIPTDRDPFVLTINSMVYVYSAGATVDVPAEVAEAIDAYKSLNREPEPMPAPGTVGQVWTRTKDGSAWMDLPEPPAPTPTPGGGGVVYLDCELNPEDSFYYATTDKSVIRAGLEAGAEIVLRIPQSNQDEYRYCHMVYFKDWNDENGDFEMGFFGWSGSAVWSWGYYSDDEPLSYS